MYNENDYDCDYCGQEIDGTKVTEEIKVLEKKIKLTENRIRNKKKRLGDEE